MLWTDEEAQAFGRRSDREPPRGKGQGRIRKVQIHDMIVCSLRIEMAS